MSDHRHLKGMMSETKAQFLLMQQGYHVFVNYAGSGPIDLVAIHPDTGEVRLIDVKTRATRKDGSRIHRVPKQHQKEIGVEVMEVDIDECPHI
jgi:Holliday junction resolvase-like predicted endonuclease